MSSDKPPEGKDELRRRLIEHRRKLPDERREANEHEIRRAVHLLCEQTRSQRIAAYVACGGEPDLMSMMARLHEIGREICLPVVRDRRMHFRVWHPDGAMEPNRFGIPEPAAGAEYEPRALELVLVPLVGFSDDGARLGMGAGFYDRAFEFRRNRVGRVPRLIGVAHAVQEAPSLPIDDWDVPLDGVITENGLRWFA